MHQNGITCSSLCNISYGVPQGSILGPLLFILFINDLVFCSKLLYYVLFADDSNFLLSNKCLSTLVRNVNRELYLVGLWFRANLLSVNMKKTHFMLFKGKKVVNLEFEIVLYGRPLKNETSTKFLGIIIDNDLTWSLHLNYIRNKISKLCGILYNIKKLFEFKIATLVI